MATTGFWPVKNHLREVLAYADNPEKTTGPNGLDRDLLQTLHYAADGKKSLFTENCGIGKKRY